MATLPSLPIVAARAGSSGGGAGGSGSVLSRRPSTIAAARARRTRSWPTTRTLALTRPGARRWRERLGATHRRAVGALGPSSSHGSVQLPAMAAQPQPQPLDLRRRRRCRARHGWRTCRSSSRSCSASPPGTTRAPFRASHTRSSCCSSSRAPDIPLLDQQRWRRSVRTAVGTPQLLLYIVGSPGAQVGPHASGASSSSSRRHWCRCSTGSSPTRRLRAAASRSHCS